MTNQEKHKKAYEKYLQDSPCCNFCGSSLPYEKRRQKFCSNSCSASKNNNLREVTWKKKRITFICEECGSNFKGIESIRRKFCSVKCQGQKQHNRAVSEWLEGKRPGHHKSGGLSEFVREFLFEKRGKKCEQCGWCEVNPTTGKIPIHIDHIDGIWENSTLENLRILCPNCHSLTPTFGILNKGKGREYRRSYYNR